MKARSLIILTSLAFLLCVAKAENLLNNQVLSTDLLTNQTNQPLGAKMFGMHLPQSPWFIHKLDSMESTLGRDIDLVHWFGSFDYEFEAAPFENVIASGRVPLFTWQAINQPLSDIVGGRHDRYIESYAEGIRQLDEAVYVRLLPEMNGQWEVWNGDPITFIRAWQHIADLFKNQGADNVKWVWAPNVTDHPNIQSNFMERYYPGDDYVDILGLSGYNWGTVQQNTAWTSFKDIYQTPYERLTNLSNKPIWIAEIATTEQGGDKAQWIREMIQSEDFPSIEAFVWFQENKETNWTIDSSPESLSAFRSMFVLVSQ